jgi:outer membrane protein OmpA-like peptidoglycan-associated protein
MKLKIIALVAAAAMMASACTTMPTLGAAARPECAAKSYTIYYSYHEDDLRASAAPIIGSIADQVAACQKAGGKLQRVTIIGFPGRAVDSPRGDQTAFARGQAVQEALISAGLPAKQIKLANYRSEPDDASQPMRRRAEITLKMR